MPRDDDSQLTLDDGTPLHALNELRRALGPHLDRETLRISNNIERAQSAVVQADHAKTVPEAIRHLVKALAAAAEFFILTPKKMQDTYEEALNHLDRQVQKLAAAIPRMPPTPGEVAFQVESTAKRVEAVLKSLDEKAASVDARLTATSKAVTTDLRAAGVRLANEASELAANRRWHGYGLFISGLVLGVLLAVGYHRL